MIPPDEDLIKYAFPNDVWFHVDKLSSAHICQSRPSASSTIPIGVTHDTGASLTGLDGVDLRLPESIEFANIPVPLLMDAAQLVKANSVSLSVLSINLG